MKKSEKKKILDYIFYKSLSKNNKIKKKFSLKFENFDEFFFDLHL